MKKIIGICALIILFLCIDEKSFAQSDCAATKATCRTNCALKPASQVQSCYADCDTAYEACVTGNGDNDDDCNAPYVRCDGTCKDINSCSDQNKNAAYDAKCKGKTGKEYQYCYQYEKCIAERNFGSQQDKTCKCIANGGIVLNTDFPFIGRCIEKSSDGKVISGIAGVFTNILMTLIITIGFGMVIRGGVQFAMNKPAEGKKTIMNVVIAFAALGSLGIILRLINPNFFK